MKGLDDYITGKNDPNAPFNQVDWTEIYDAVIDKCKWITDVMLDDDDTHETLGNIIGEIHQKLVEPEKYYNSKERHQFILVHADEMAASLKEEYDFVQQFNNQDVRLTGTAFAGKIGKVKNGFIRINDTNMSGVLTKDWKVEAI